MKRTFFRVVDVTFNPQHDCDFVTLEDRTSASRFMIGEFAFAATPAVGDEIVRLEDRKGHWLGYRSPTVVDRLLGSLSR